MSKYNETHYQLITAGLWLAIICFFTLVSLVITYLLGYSLKPIGIFFEHKQYVIGLLGVLLGVYQLVNFIVQSACAAWKYGPEGLAHSRLHLDYIKPAVLQTLLLFVVIFCILAYQTSFKTIFNQTLTIPNWNDWILYTIDQQLGLQHLGLLVSYQISSVYFNWFIKCLDAFYMPSFALQWILIFYIACNDTSWSRKNTFITCFILMWLIGTLLGGICQSGGPFFFSVGARNLLLMAKLDQVNAWWPLSSTYTQNVLWDNYFNDSLTLGHGISAFPSMHVAVSLFVYLYARERQVGQWLAACFVLMTWLGSVFLGWHYWVDGIGAFCVVMVSYWSAKRLNQFFSFVQ